MKIRGTDFVVFHVADLRRSARFYREVLRLPQQIYSEEHQWAEFDAGNVTLALKGGAAPADRTSEARIALAVDDIDAAYAELRGAGVPLSGPPANHGCCQHLEVHDPDGRIVILHRRADGTFA